MDGLYLNKKKHESFISRWIDDAIKNKSWKVYKDLHIDEIDDSFKDKSTWIKNALYIYEIFNNVLKDGYNYFLVIPLTYGEKPTDFNFVSWEEIELLLDLTPPSFYIYPDGEKNYEETIESLVCLDVLCIESKYRVLFKEEEESKNEYIRILYVTR